MTGFNEDSAMPERNQGHVEHLRDQPDVPNAEPSAQATDRFGLEAAGKSYLLRKFNVAVSAAGNPYFTPIDHLLLSFQTDADAILELARSRHVQDAERVEQADRVGITALAYFNVVTEEAGEGREWVARKRVIWPLTDELGFQLYKAAAGIEDLADFAAYLLRTDANINTMEDVQLDERYVKRQFWSDLAIAEAGTLDAIIQLVDETSYNLDWLVREGYRSQANLDTRTHLRGVRENAPITSDQSDVKAQMKAALMAG